MPKLTLEQQRIVNHQAGDILVTASAGSGKTHTMIERVIKLVTEGKADVKEILAVTFTEMAALEMKEKLKKALNDAIVATGDKKLLEQIADVHTADICTLHAFCAKLIRNYFFKVGLSPDYGISDQAQADIIRSECIDATFKQFYEKKEKWFLTMVDRYAQKRTDTGLKEIVLSAYDFCMSEADPETILQKHKENYTKQGYERIKESYKDFLDREMRAIRADVYTAKKVFDRDGLTKSSKLCEVLFEYTDAIIDDSGFGALLKYKEITTRFDFDKKLTEEQLEYKQMVTDCRDRYKKVVKQYLSAVEKYFGEEDDLESCMQDTENLVNLIRAFGKNYETAKREENLLDFSDLEHFALKILEDEEITSDVKSKYKYVFVDEYQDTNGVQDKIISTVSNNNLLMVGDAKQSIYGFRGCRPELFTNKSSQMERSGQTVVRLNDNFRSARAVVNMVNRIFDFCMVEEFFGEEYSQTSQLRFGGLFPEQAEGRAKFSFLKRDGAKKKQEEPRVYDLIEDLGGTFDEDISSTASLITKIINEELQNTYYGVKSDSFKPVQYKDITILARTKKSAYVQNLVRGLKRHGIPVSSEVTESVCDYPEIDMLVNALKLVDCFVLDVPLATTLRGPIGGFTDEELLDIVTFFDESGGDKRSGFAVAFDYYLVNAKTTLQSRLSEFKKYIEELRYLSDYVGAQGVLKKLVLDKDLEACFLSWSNGKARAKRLSRFLLASCDGGRILSVKEFLSKVEQSPDAFGFADCEQENDVKVMTIHASKGLEFPVVIVCGMEKGLNSRSGTAPVLFNRKYGFAVKSFDDAKRSSKETLLRGLVQKLMEEERVREEMRLLYVATTRATYSLHLTYCGRKENRRRRFVGAEKFMDYIPKDLELDLVEEQDLSFTDLSRGTRKVIIADTDQSKVEEMRNRFGYVYPFEVDTTLPLKTTVTKANQKNMDEDQAKSVVLFNQEGMDTEKGVTAHKILELYDFCSGEGLFTQVQTMIEAGELTAEKVADVDLNRIKSAIDSPAFKGLEKSQLFREQSFMVKLPANMVLDVDTSESVLLQGIIDLLVLDSDGARILDYKYSKKSAESLVATYKKQLDLYAYAVEKVLGVKVNEKTIVNVYTGQTVKIP
ncbi:MAG: UvrD-helicase domain-containing protein [Clostridia bacterium]|nr:UvrD-helicase domain-containing protein [Clostridia bacterium]